MQSMKIIFSHSTDPTFNLAAEEYLFNKRESEILLLYINEPSVIIGSNQAVVNEVDMDYCIDRSIRIIRRMSGGGAVYNDMGNINFTFIRHKRDDALGPAFLEPMVDVLTAMGIPAEIGKRKDLWLAGYKITGTAAHISRGWQLHHGTLLYDTETDVLVKSLTPERRDLVQKATASVVSPVRNIRDYLIEQNGSAPNRDDFFDLLSVRFLEYFGVDRLSAFTDDEVQEIGALQREKYTQREWNYKK